MVSSISAVWATVGASLVMGAAVATMHYTGMAAVSVHVAQKQTGESSTSLLAFLLVMLAGPVAALILAAAIVMFDPEVVGGQRDWADQAAPAAIPAPPPWPPTDRTHSPVADRRYTS